MPPVQPLFSFPLSWKVRYFQNQPRPCSQQVVFGTVSITLSNNKEQERRTFGEALVWSTVFWAMYLGNIPGARMMLLLRNEQSQ